MQVVAVPQRGGTQTGEAFLPLPGQPETDTAAPNLAALQSEYEALQAQKEALYADYGKLKKKVREYDIIKQNIDSILQANRQPEREKETERGYGFADSVYLLPVDKG